VVSFHFCNFADETNDIADIFTSLVGQVIRQINAPEQSPAMNHFEKSDGGTVKPDLNALLELFVQLSEQLNTVYICLDAVDECQDEQRQSLLGSLLSLAYKSKNIKIILSCRIGNYLNTANSSNYQKIEITRDHVNQDLRNYVHFRVDNGPERLKRALSNQMIENLINSADGMQVNYTPLLLHLLTSYAAGFYGRLAN
jgi:hypothetical protein